MGYKHPETLAQTNIVCSATQANVSLLSQIWWL